MRWVEHHAASRFHYLAYGCERSRDVTNLESHVSPLSVFCDHGYYVLAFVLIELPFAAEYDSPFICAYFAMLLVSTNAPGARTQQLPNLL